MDSWIHLLTKKIPAYGFPCVFADKAACLYFILLFSILWTFDEYQSYICFDGVINR